MIIIKSSVIIIKSSGGGFHRTVCQLVDWMFSKCSVETSGISETLPRKTTRGSREKRCAMCRARIGSMPRSTSFCRSASSYGAETSLRYLEHLPEAIAPFFASLVQMYVEIEA